MQAQGSQEPQDVPIAAKSQAPEPLQVARQTPSPIPHSFSGSLPAAWPVHWPARPVWLHDTHLPSHALSQHTPSTQKPEAQALPLKQVRPFLVLQLPLPSHAWLPEQLLGTSVPAAACTQVPSWPATLQDWQTPEQAAIEQQTPSTQKPEAQLGARAAVHPSPLPRFATLYSQVSLDPE
jgi:hypothetical protein